MIYLFSKKFKNCGAQHGRNMIYLFSQKYKNCCTQHEFYDIKTRHFHYVSLYTNGNICYTKLILSDEYYGGYFIENIGPFKYEISNLKFIDYHNSRYSRLDVTKSVLMNKLIREL